MYKPEYYDKMQNYFKECNADITGKKSPRELRMASLPLLALALGISVSELKSYESDDGAGAEFYVDMITQYEAICDRYEATGMMKADQRKRLNETVFASVGAGSRQDIVVVFPKWNAPDNYEHYEKAVTACEETNTPLIHVPGIIKQKARERAGA